MVAPPKRMSMSKSQELVNVILLGKRVFVDALKELKMRPSWVTWSRGLNLVTSILIRVRRRKDRQKSRRQCDHRDRDAKSHQVLEEAKNRSSFRASRKSMTRSTP